MRRVLPPFVLLLVTILAASCGGAADPTATGTPDPAGIVAATVDRETDGDVAAAARSVNTFTADVLAEVAGGDNLVVSPASIAMAFTQAWAGARGVTAAEIADVLTLPDDPVSAYGALDAAVTRSSDDGAVVVTGNRLFPDVGLTLQQEWVDDLARSFGTAVETLDLDDEEAARQRINEWVAERTRDRITDLLQPGFLQPSTRLVLANTLYLEADWTNPFGKYTSELDTFTTADGRRVPADFLLDYEGMDGVTGPGWQAVGRELSDGYDFWIVLPDEGAAPADVLTAQVFDALAEASQHRSGSLEFPEFTIATELDLVEVLQPMGIEAAFGPADFSGITGDADLFIGSAVHAADIAVDDVGVVAAAATAVGFALSGSGPQAVHLVADRPFGYVVRHTATGTVLFAGQVMDPSVSDR